MKTFKIQDPRFRPLMRRLLIGLVVLSPAVGLTNREESPASPTEEPQVQSLSPLKSVVHNESEDLDDDASDAPTLQSPHD